ncbi:MAG: DinB family protein [Bacteroidetes bacterium]|nr:DinB family protein [Bacteroidota bacterium]
MKRLTQFLTAMALLFVSASAFAQFTQKEMIAEWQRAKYYTKSYLDAMPEDGYAFKPTPEIRSFAQQMLHLADANYLFASSASGKPNSLGIDLPHHDVLQKTSAETKDAVTKAVMDSYDFAISTLQSMTPDQLQESIKFGSKTTITRSGLYGKGFEHQTHHRGQTTIYLRLKGVTPPNERLF